MTLQAQSGTVGRDSLCLFLPLSCLQSPIFISSNSTLSFHLSHFLSQSLSSHASNAAMFKKAQEALNLVPIFSLCTLRLPTNRIHNSIFSSQLFLSAVCVYVCIYNT